MIVTFTVWERIKQSVCLSVGLFVPVCKFALALLGERLVAT